MNLKLRLNVIITLILLLVILIGAVVTIKNAANNIQAEIASTAILALQMFDAEILGLRVKNSSLIKGRFVFHLRDLKNVRHLKIDFFDNFGKLQDSNRVKIGSQQNQAPAWFVNAMDAVTGKLPSTRQSVFMADGRVGELVITPDISYEINEEWQATKGILVLLSIFFLVVNIVVYIAVNIALRPIDDILTALTELESGNLKSRLPKFTLPELSSISDKFNIMAETLQSSIENNHHLSQQLMRLQEDERKNLAQELHDEIGQHLTAIRMDVAVIKGAKTIDTAQESATAIDVVVRRMMEIVRTILQRLRPSDLDELGLEVALKELISAWLTRNPDIHLDFHISGNFIDLDDALLISIYRLVQECLTNIARHANANSITISIEKNNSQINMMVTDNGNGFDHTIKPKGFGLLGMRERVEGLAGKFKLTTAINKGVIINIELPSGIKRKE
ncbi:MAG: sensor histidine kinase [Methylococcales symbiont of Hymedesmia sp. n. MRB-2018]|nr:MAG: sensor histidine kinase [Methylococcales symbiont of Hymedesmia sp. n. MRB-2018]